MYVRVSVVLIEPLFFVFIFVMRSALYLLPPIRELCCTVHCCVAFGVLPRTNLRFAVAELVIFDTSSIADCLVGRDAGRLKGSGLLSRVCYDTVTGVGRCT